jgi:hypothetical protein
LCSAGVGPEGCVLDHRGIGEFKVCFAQL